MFCVSMSPACRRAARRHSPPSRPLCEDRLHGRYELEVIDIYRHPQLAIDEQIIAVPTLVK